MATMTSIDTTRTTTTGMVEVPQYVVNPTMSDICNFSEEEQASYFTSLQQQWADESLRAMNETMAWKYSYEFHHVTPFNREACDDKIKEVLEELTNQDPGLIVAKFYHSGILNHPMFKKYVIGLQPYPEKQRTATVAYGKIKYLISVRDKLEEPSPSDNTIGQPPLSKDENSVMLYEQLKSLDFFLSKTPNYDLLYALKDAHHAKGYEWAKNNTQFGKKIQPILRINEGTIIQGLNRASKELKMECYKYEYHSLSSLEEEKINLPVEKNRKEAHKKWKWYHARVKEVVS